MFFAFLSSCLTKCLVGGVLAVLPIRLTTTDSKVVSGELVEVSVQSVRVTRNGEEVTFPVDSVAELRSLQPRNSTGPAVHVGLVSGSEIAVQDYSLADDQLRLEPRRQPGLVVPVKQVHWIRFRAANATTDPGWLGLLAGPARRSDTLAIRRDGGKIDQISGVVEGISGTSVQFNIDGNTVDAPRDKLEGIVFGGSASTPDGASIQVQDVYGSRWVAMSVTSNGSGDALSLDLGGGVLHDLPLPALEAIRWQSGQVMLVSTEPASANYTPYLANTDLGSGNQAELLDDWFSPSAVNKTDLLMHATSSIEYRVDPGFVTLSGAVAIESSGRLGGKVIVRISVDGDQVWQQELSGAESKGFALTIKDARRIRLSVAASGDGDVGDTVRVGSLRVTK